MVIFCLYFRVHDSVFVGKDSTSNMKKKQKQATVSGILVFIQAKNTKFYSCDELIIKS